jgi:hypothetical protein
MYTEINFKTKKAFKEAVAAGDEVRVFQPGLGNVPLNGRACVEGPHSPKPHTWYAEVQIKNGLVVSVK